MRNPYEILEIKENASKEEIKKAYRELAKKYHPDQYGDNPLKDLAEEKMIEINEAYDYLMKNSNDNSNRTSSSSYDNYSSADNSTDNYSIYQSIRMDINSRNFSSAERKLNGINSRDAQWHYLMGIVNMQKGWYDAAYSNISTACNLDPSNMEYREAFSKIQYANQSYRQPFNTQRDNSICNICATLYCIDCFCNGMSGC